MKPEERKKICEECPIVKRDPYYGMVCDRNKWISPDGKKSSSIPIPGYKRGCGCRLGIKQLQPSAKCIVGKWD